jgi:hypothetical protein
MTRITIDGDKFVVDGAPTHAGKTFSGASIEGTLFNTRMVQATFDDTNPETAQQWAYPDTGIWDAERNVREFMDALPIYRGHGIDAITINLQGGMPVYKTETTQPWENSAFTSDGELKPDYLERVRRVIEAADDNGIVVIVGFFYIAQTRLLADEAAVFRATENATRWLLETGRENILVEIANEIDVPLFHHDVLTPGRIAELIDAAKSVSKDGRRLLVSASFTWFPLGHDAGIEVDLDREGFEFLAKMAGARVDDVVRASDFVLFHTNTLEPEQAGKVIDAVRRHPAIAERLVPLLINEDGTYVESLEVSASKGIGWGYYDQGHANDYVEGFQSPPVNWGLSTDEKRAFFSRVKEITGA